MAHPSGPRPPESQSPPSYSGGQPPFGPPPEPGRTRVVALVTAVVAVLVLVVGGAVAVTMLRNSETTSAAGTTSTTGTAPTTDATTDSTTAPTTDSSTGPTTAPTDATVSSPAGDLASYCTQLGALQAQFSDLASSTMTDADIDAMATGLRELQPVAPADARDDIETFTSGLESMRDLLDDLGISFTQLQDPAYVQSRVGDWTPRQRQRLDGVAEQLSDPAFQAAGKAIDDDYEARC